MYRQKAMNYKSSTFPVLLYLHITHHEGKYKPPRVDLTRRRANRPCFLRRTFQTYSLTVFDGFHRAP